MPGEAQVSEGTTEYTPMLGGRYLMGKFKGTMMGGPFEGFSLGGYDNAKKQYFSMWFDSMGTGYYVSHGTASADGKTITYHGSMYDASINGDVKTREVVTMIDKNKHVFEMYQTREGQESKVMEITYTRG
jgi:hypothetical protein